MEIKIYFIREKEEHYSYESKAYLCSAHTEDDAWNFIKEEEGECVKETHYVDQILIPTKNVELGLLYPPHREEEIYEPPTVSASCFSSYP